MLSNRERLVVGFYFFKDFFPFIKVNKFIVIKGERVEERYLSHLG